jgi:hypothetical protein
MKASEKDTSFHVPSIIHALGGLVHRNPAFWVRLSRLETSLLGPELSGVAIDRPIYVCGLARSGSTLLHELIASHPGVATLRNKDYPMLFTPYWWRRASAKFPPSPAKERPHQDGVMVSPESPDALEEVFWRAFFPRCHDPSIGSILDGNVREPAFESFYRAQIRKLLLAEGATRYAAKANYHVARLQYLVKLFPDSRILVPVRAPESHIASLKRQHEIFTRGHRRFPRSLAYMKRAGHFEFGLDRRPLNLGDDMEVRRIQDAWKSGDEVRGLALYWNMVYAYLKTLLESDASLQRVARVVKFEDVCSTPRESLFAALRHCELPEADSVSATYAVRIREPNYYDSGLSRTDRATIREVTAATAERWGYRP